MESATVFSIVQQSIVGKCNKSNYCLTSATNSQIVVCADCQFNLHSLQVGKTIATTHTWKGHTAKINEISFMEATGELANVFTTAGSDGKVIFWDTRMADAVKIVEINRPCYCTASNANMSLVGCDRDAFIMYFSSIETFEK
jgi:WD40 repeat protein